MLNTIYVCGTDTWSRKSIYMRKKKRERYLIFVSVTFLLQLKIHEQWWAQTKHANWKILHINLNACCSKCTKPTLSFFIANIAYLVLYQRSFYFNFVFRLGSIKIFHQNLKRIKMNQAFTRDTIKLNRLYLYRTICKSHHKHIRKVRHLVKNK